MKVEIVVMVVVIAMVMVVMMVVMVVHGGSQAGKGPQSTAPATKSALQGPQNTSKYCTCHEIALQGPQRTAPATCHKILHFKVHKVLRLPRNLHFKVHEVLDLPRLLKTSHMHKSHDSLHLPRNQSMPKTTTMSKVLRLPQILPPPISCTCHEKSTLDHRSMRFPLRLPRKVTTKSKNAHGATTRAHLCRAPSRGQRFARPCAAQQKSLGDFGTFRRACAAKTSAHMRAPCSPGLLQGPLSVDALLGELQAWLHDEC